MALVGNIKKGVIIYFLAVYEISTLRYYSDISNANLPLLTAATTSSDLNTSGLQDKSKSASSHNKSN